MQTVTTEQARDTLPELLKQVENGPVLIRDGGEDVAVLVSPDRFNREQLAKVESFEKSRDEMVVELSRNLTRANIDFSQFVKDFLA